MINHKIVKIIIRKTHNLITSFSEYETIDRDRSQLSKFQSKNFSDSIRLTLIAGDGGNGCTSYYTDKIIRRGQPDGGCGGRGGDIYIQAHSSLYDLSHLRRRKIQGNDGGTGGPRGKDGKNGGKTIVRVPCGTLLHQIQITINPQTEEKTQHKKFLKDLGQNLDVYLTVKGGEGGKGNKRFPFRDEENKFGSEGQQKIIYLELKTLADIGLVGFPNIGKSTFLAAVSRALPKIANYEFTTLKPSVGYVKFVDEFQMTMADIPGIIEGAHENKGLGLQFLRHIERTKVLVFMLDITSKDPLQQLEKLQNQLRQYDKQKFQQKQKIVVFNKLDCLPNSQQRFNELKPKIHMPSFLVSAKEGINVGNALVELRRLVEKVLCQEKQNRESSKSELIF